MNILLIGDYSSKYDEGLKNIAKNFLELLQHDHNVKTINVKNITSRYTLRTLIHFHPSIIHYFSNPSFASFIFLKLLKIRWNKSKTILSALHPKNSIFLQYPKTRRILKLFLKPDILLYQTQKEMYNDVCNNVYFIPNGIDIDKFLPVSFEKKIKLRKKLGLEQEKFLILHVGHLSELRNIMFLKSIQKDFFKNVQVLIIGSTYVFNDRYLFNELVKSGCVIIDKYIKSIESYYQAADCYIFPVPWGNTIYMPLSILEAMSCNLPIISTYNPIFENFKDDGFIFFNNYEELHNILRNLINNKNKNVINNRIKIIDLSWKKIIDNLVEIYERK